MFFQYPHHMACYDRGGHRAGPRSLPPLPKGHPSHHATVRNTYGMLSQVYHLIWITLLLLAHLRMVMVNATTYESIKGRRWVDNTTHGKPFYMRYPLNCFRFFFRSGAEGSGVVSGTYGRVPTQVGVCRLPTCRTC